MLKLEEILETEKLWAAFSKKGLIWLSLQGPFSEDQRNNDKDHLYYSTVDLTRNFAREPAEHSVMEMMLVRETYHFLHTGRHQMPLDFSSFTSFQQTVFSEVLKIAPGTTTTYKKIATQLGNSNSARAVGTAISLNPVAYFVPTHRVLPSTRGIGICKSGAGHLREKLLRHEGHDLNVLCKSRNTSQ
ncbi:MAG TPA: MGMT family protein [Bacillales bacterium]|nr:MGMT family protein [Bacillales bacterium]